MTATIFTSTLISGPFELIEESDNWPYVLATYELEMDASTEIPDAVGTLIAYWRNHPDVTALVPAERISGKIKTGAPTRTFYIVPKKAGGSERINVPRILPRVDVRCYGSNEYEAMRLWRIVHPTLVPLDRRSWMIQV